MVIAETGTAPLEGDDLPTPGRGCRVVASAPVLLPVVVGSLGVVGTFLLLLGQFRVPLVLVLGGVLAAVLVRVVGLQPAAESRRGRAWDGLAVLVSAAFAVVNGAYAAQNVVVGRDPGVYTVAGQWLAHHHSALVPRQEGVFAFSQVTTGSAGLGVSDPQHLFLQGAHLLPQMLALVSATLGESAMFRVNVVLGGVGLLAVYGFGRLLVSRGWALLAIVLLSGSLPQIAFARDNYTEPLSQLLVFGGLSLLWSAGRGRSGRWAVAGLVIGASCMARIDAFLVLPSLFVFLALVVAVAPPGVERRLASRDALAALASAAVPSALGVLDLSRLSNGYFHDLHGQFHMIQVLLLLSGAAAVLLVGLAWSTPVMGRMAAAQWRRPVAYLAALGVVLAGLALAVRPVLETQRAVSTSNVQQFIKTMQAAEGSTVDPTRTYAEHSVVWLSWYLGPALVVAALAGAAWLVVVAVRAARLELMPFLLVFLSMSALYLYDPSITPDQVWAMRRFVPIIMPGAALSAVFVLHRLRPRVPARWAPGVAAVTGLGLLVPIAHVTYPLARVREGVPQLKEVQRVCARLPREASVLLIGNLLSTRYPQTIRSYCSVPAASLMGATTPAVLATVAHNAKAAGYPLYVVATGESRPLVATRPGTPAPVPVSQVAVLGWHRNLSHPPRVVDVTTRSMYVGRVGADGLVAWLEPASPVD